MVIQKHHSENIGSYESLLIDIVSFHLRLISILFVFICIDFTAKYKIHVTYMIKTRIQKVFKQIAT